MDCISHGLRWLFKLRKGQGIALIGGVIAEQGLKASRLVRPLEHTIPLSFAYYFVCAKSKTRLPRVHVFKQWLLNEVSREA